LTKWRRSHEDAGYVGKVNADLARATTAYLQRRKAHTLLKWVKGHDGHHGNEMADELAGLGARKPAVDAMDLSVPPELKLTGVKLSTLTQSQAYKAIIEDKVRRLEKRRRTGINMAQVLDDLEGAFGVQVTEGAVWRGVRNKVLQIECRYFLWMTIHDGYRI
ncbi:hypothetical protein HDZ31DRAFT_24316, partial [Schizophyllum fasciatum]